MDDPSDVAGKVSARFPRWKASIQRLLAQDSEFREMCLDYVEAGRALAHWSALSSDVENHTAPALYEQPERIAEQYRILLYELEAEILEALARDEGRSG